MRAARVPVVFLFFHTSVALALLLIPDTGLRSAGLTQLRSVGSHVSHSHPMWLWGALFSIVAALMSRAGLDRPRLLGFSVAFGCVLTVVMTFLFVWSACTHGGSGALGAISFATLGLLHYRAIRYRRADAALVLPGTPR